jgi:hypothetical protein
MHCKHVHLHNRACLAGVSARYANALGQAPAEQPEACAVAEAPAAHAGAFAITATASVPASAAAREAAEQDQQKAGRPWVVNPLSLAK